MEPHKALAFCHILIIDTEFGLAGAHGPQARSLRSAGQITVVDAGTVALRGRLCWGQLQLTEHISHCQR